MPQQSLPITSDTPQTFEVIQVNHPDLLDAARHIRQVVFVEEQQVPSEEEWDDQDEHCWHWVIRETATKAFVATARLADKGNGVAKVERVAVLKTHRGYGLGRLILIHLEQKARELGFTHLKMHGQTHAQVFYEKLGYFVTKPEIFMEANIPHVLLEKNLA